MSFKSLPASLARYNGTIASLDLLDQAFISFAMVSGLFNGKFPRKIRLLPVWPGQHLPLPLWYSEEKRATLENNSPA
ncbi:MAG: hypothetical protein WAV55_08255 [Clostridiaceae bacterium]